MLKTKKYINESGEIVYLIINVLENKIIFLPFSFSKKEEAEKRY